MLPILKSLKAVPFTRKGSCPKKRTSVIPISNSKEKKTCILYDKFLKKAKHNQ